LTLFQCLFPNIAFSTTIGIAGNAGVAGKAGQAGIESASPLGQAKTKYYEMLGSNPLAAFMSTGGDIPSGYETVLNAKGQPRLGKISTTDQNRAFLNQLQEAVQTNKMEVDAAVDLYRKQFPDAEFTGKLDEVEMKLQEMEDIPVGFGRHLPWNKYYKLPKDTRLHGKTGEPLSQFRTPEGQSAQAQTNQISGAPQPSRQSPYPEYPDAYQENGAWKVVRNGQVYRIEE